MDTVGTVVGPSLGVVLLGWAQACITWRHFFVAGLYVAVQEALESTVTADMVSADALGISYAALGTVNGTAKFISSAAVGILWTAVSSVFGFGSAAVLMAADTVALARMQMR